MYGIAVLSINSSTFTSCYTSGWVSACLGVIVHGTSRAGDHACMYVHSCGGACSLRAAHLTRCMITTCMPKSLALYRPERSTTAHTSHRAHAMLRWLSPSCSLVHSLWHRCGMHNRDTLSQCGGEAPAWVMAEGTRPMW